MKKLTSLLLVLCLALSLAACGSLKIQINNNSAGAVAYALVSENISEESQNLFQHSVITMSYMLILAVVFTILILKDSKKQKIPAEI